MNEKTCMVKRIEKKNRLEMMVDVLVRLFVLSSLLIPTAFVNKVFFALILLIYAADVLYAKKITTNFIAPILILLVFFVGFCQGMVLGCDASLAKQFLLSTMLLFLIYPINHYRVDMRRVVRADSYLYFLFYIVFLIYGLGTDMLPTSAVVRSAAQSLGIGPITAIGKLLYTYGAASMGSRSFFSDSGVMIHLGSVPFLLVPVGVFADEAFRKTTEKKREIWDLLLCGFCMVLAFLSTSRALMMGILCVIAMSFLYHSGAKTKLWALIAVVVAGISVVAFLLTKSNMFSMEESSNSIKMGHITGYFDFMNIKNVLIGNGLASEYYSNGAARLLAHTEITLLDYMRYFGVIPALLVYALLFFPCVGYKKKEKLFNLQFAIFAVYVFMSLTNPVLFNSVGVVAILWYWNGLHKQSLANNDTSEKALNESLCSGCRV